MIHRIQHRSVLLLVVLVATIIAFPAFAQEQPTQEPRPDLQKRFAGKGVTEIGGSISFDWIQPVTDGVTKDASSIFSATPYIGYFPIDNLELGVNPLGVTILTSASGSTVTQLNLFFAPSYNFKTKTMAFPFVEGLAGYTATMASSSGSTTTYSGFSWGGRAGVKVAVVPSGLLVIGVQYLLITQNSSNADKRNGTNHLSISLGFTIWM
jgi:hypothetical protein